MTTTVDQFRMVSSSLSLLVNSGDALILISRPYTASLISIEVDDHTDAVVDAVAQIGLSNDEFQEATESVALALGVAVEERPPRIFARQNSGKSPGDELTEAEIDEAGQKIEIVSRDFDVDALRARAWVKKGSKHDIILQRSWEVTRKEADSDPDCPVGSGSPPVGVLRISSGSIENPLSLLSGEGTDHLVAVVDRVDIRSLIKVLERFDCALEQALVKDIQADD